MLRTIKITNPYDETLTIDLYNPSTSGLRVSEITGLGPVKGAISSTDMGSQAGSIYNSTHIGNRNIVFKFDLLENPTIEDSRLNTYRYFSVGSEITLRFETDHRVGSITGHVESNEPDIFSNKANTVISVICEDPYFKKPNGISTSYFAASSLFEFPFENDSLTKDMIEFGSINVAQVQSINYEGDASTGFILRAKALDFASNFAIYDEATGDGMKITSSLLVELTGNDIQPLDEIIIDTITGERAVLILRNGEYTNILNTVGRKPDWLQLHKGSNRIGYTASSGAKRLQVSIENPVLYEGV